MRAPPALLLCCLAGAVSAVPTFTKASGEALEVACVFAPPPGRRFLLKVGSSREEVLVESSLLEAHSSRFSIKYAAQMDAFTVGISTLSPADSGRYRCGVDGPPHTHREFDVKVTDAMCDVSGALPPPGGVVCAEPEGGSVRVRCSLSSAEFFPLFLCKDECRKQDVLVQTGELGGRRGRHAIQHDRGGVFYATISNLSREDAGLYRCGVDLPSSPNPCQGVELHVTPVRDPVALTAPGSGSCTAASAPPQSTAGPTAAATAVAPADKGFNQQQPQCDGGSGCPIPTFTKASGEALEVACVFAPPPGRRFLLKVGSSREEVLVESSLLEAHSSRFSIKYAAQMDAFTVGISTLSPADSGRYRCGVDGPPHTHREFDVKVTDAMCDVSGALPPPGGVVCAEREGGSVRVRCSLSSAEFFPLFLCKDECRKQDVLVQTGELGGRRGRHAIQHDRGGVFYATISNLSREDAGLYRCGVDLPSSPNPCQGVELHVTPARDPRAPTAPSSGSCIAVSAPPPASTTAPAVEQQQAESSGRAGYAVAVVCVAAVLLVGVLLILYKKRRICRGADARDSSAGENIEQVELRGGSGTDENVQNIEQQESEREQLQSVPV